MCIDFQRYYIVGSNYTETAFRVLKIDRTEPRELHIQDDKVTPEAKILLVPWGFAFYRAPDKMGINSLSTRDENS